ncbi:MAG: hypothetical protein SVV03_02180 [Candidatus Nanohaloarchaea archaeon]|nr:hypothetical protein [Candidatus Nanohaloarchaea archaeon]
MSDTKENSKGGLSLKTIILILIGAIAAWGITELILYFTGTGEDLLGFFADKVFGKLSSGGLIVGLGSEMDASNDLRWRSR